MATYKVPQDVEADDKLLGPFSFRQFIYLMVVFGLVVLGVGLFQVHPVLVIIPIPFALFFVVLALPLRKDQPMETYLAALVSFYTKPNKRYWVPGQSNSTILITAPKITEAPRARDISGDDASHRLSFLAEIVDSEGHAIKNASTIMKDDFYAEAYNTTDMFDRQSSYNYGLSNIMTQEKQERRNAVIDSMRSAISESEFNYDNANLGMVQLPGQRTIAPREGFSGASNSLMNSGAPGTISGFESPNVIQPIFSTPAPTEGAPAPDYSRYDAAIIPDSYATSPTSAPQETPTTQPQATISQAPTLQPTNQPSTPTNPIPDIQAEADRIRQENESEVYVSLH